MNFNQSRLDQSRVDGKQQLKPKSLELFTVRIIMRSDWPLLTDPGNSSCTVITDFKVACLVFFMYITPASQLPDPPWRRLCLSVLYLKRYIYTCICFEREPNILEFQTKLLSQWRMENVLLLLFLSLLYFSVIIDNIFCQ